MRLGSRFTYFRLGKLGTLYGEVTVVEERHRHRYEANSQYIEELEKTGLTFIGKLNTGKWMEIFE